MEKYQKIIYAVSLALILIGIILIIAGLKIYYGGVLIGIGGTLLFFMLSVDLSLYLDELVEQDKLDDKLNNIKQNY